MEKLIVTVALTGNVPTKAMNPHLPETADEIAADVKRCLDARASVFHMHARDAAHKPTLDLNSPQFVEYLARIFQETGVKPEIEVFETGMINNALLLKFNQI